MKTAKLIIKIVVALCAVAAAVYVAATYGDKIVAWCKNLLEKCPCKCCGAKEEKAEETEVTAETEEAAPAAEAPHVDESSAPTAEESDFVG